MRYVKKMWAVNLSQLNIKQVLQLLFVWTNTYNL